ncbi:MAG: GTP cyclohydrolase I FolE [Verrucomicrobiota bacterium]|jgi:GTP cyclohydrolase I|nr:GTP cyclohydrolase I FolE [Verrucomicrobiota bacterium]MDI9383378.1 GTP cyclohydrolase I FolE [Verrucomicrobiota bacterium]HCF95840.1 GTP cyclohydrolase I FolE [Verrucomicrobiota bacterium]
MDNQNGFDAEAIKQAFRTILRSIGEDPDREGLKETPCRVARMYEEIFQGKDQDPRDHLATTFDEDHHEMVILRDIPFYSMCEHHFMPFFGKAHVGYIPNGKIVGLSKLARVVEGFARRPQVQERLTSQIADAIEEVLTPKGVGVVIEGIHTCMTMRGIKKPGSVMMTSAMRGAFRSRASTRSEFMDLIRSESHLG